MMVSLFLFVGPWWRLMVVEVYNQALIGHAFLQASSWQ
jgi:hypothetical protein